VSGWGMQWLIVTVGDYLGRTYLPQISFLLVTSAPRILVLSLSRSLFVPLFLLCNISPSSTSPKPYINSDTLYFLILLSFGTTNGYISSLSMITASSPALNPRIVEEEKDVAGTLAAFCLVAGLAGGSLCSFGVTWLVSGSIFG
jgi:equilibrative nucleoside transporter 1/2/3